MKAVIKGPCYEILDFIFLEIESTWVYEKKVFLNLQI